jgi:O-antigen biosynthesis protein
MQLSIIIVNFNVKFFVEQCLHTVANAIKQINAEVIVVDNQSTDNSMAYLKPLFPWVRFIENNENIGFGRANNIAIEQCKGDYIVLLNPDTLLPEDCFEKCIDFFNKQKDCGAIGVRMIDGSGTFLPESKRAFPSPLVSFYKIVGLSTFFPKSAIFNKYALGNLNENEVHEVAVLAGAFMMVKKVVLHSCKGFDPDFFMYGEDIDLSYRIQLAGFKNYYLGNVTIIHFKGESTKKGSLNYVKLFYSAMSIFVNKHYKGSAATLFVILFNAAIFFKAITSLIRSFVIKIGMPLFDTILILIALLGTAFFWVKYVREGVPFTQETVYVTLCSFTPIMLISAAVFGIYDNLYKPSKAFIASFIGMITVMAAYALLPESLRFSRGVILIGGFAAAMLVAISRWVLLQLAIIHPSYQADYLPTTVVVGNEENYKQVQNIYHNAGLNESIIGRVAIHNNDSNAVGTLVNLQKISTELSLQEIVLCSGAISFKEIIQIVSNKISGIHYRFFAENSNSIIGSHDKDSSGKSFAYEGEFAIARPYEKRMKRIVDMLTSFIIVFGFPLHVLCIKKPFAALQFALFVLFKNYTWVGYTNVIDQHQLPPLAINKLSFLGIPKEHNQAIGIEILQQLNIRYAKHYDYWEDIRIILKSYRHLGG